MQKDLSVEFCYENDSPFVSISKKKKIDAVFSNTTSYDMQLFCTLEVPYGFALDKQEFDVICPAFGKTYTSMFATLLESARIYYGNYSFRLTVFDNVLQATSYFDFSLNLDFDSTKILDDKTSIFDRTYVCSEDFTATAIISAHNILLVKLDTDILFESKKAQNTLEIPINFKKGINNLQIQYTCSNTETFKLNFPDTNPSFII